MSSETLKFFEEKSTEEIINWMLSNLSEDQIRMCLDQSGIPDTSVIKGKQPIAAAAAGSGPVATVTLPDGTQKQLQPGEGSSSDPPPTGEVRPSPSKERRAWPAMRFMLLQPFFQCLFVSETTKTKLKLVI